MKNRSKFLVLFLLAFILSCKNESPQESTKGTTNTLNKELTKTTNYKESGNFEESTYNINAETDSLSQNWNLNDSKRQQKLYSRFNMTQNQMQKYEKALKNWLDSDPEDPYDKFSANKRIKEEAEILKVILTKEQYKNYTEWANENDDR